MAQRDLLADLNSILEKRTPKKKTRSLSPGLIIKELLLGLVCFFIGRAVLLKNLSPFGPVLFCVLLYKGYSGPLAFISVALGLLSLGLGGLGFKYILVMVLFSLIYYIGRWKSLSWSTAKASIGVLLSMLIVNGASYLLKGRLTYDLLMGILESIIAFVMVFIFSRASDLVRDQSRRRILSGEEIISLSIGVSLLIIGCWSVQIFGISPRLVFSVFLILLFASLAGAGVGASIGVTIGFMLSLSSVPDPVLMANLAVCGLLAGVFKELGRIGSCIAFILTNALMTYYINWSTFVVLPLADLLIASIFLMLLPKAVLNYLKQFLDYSYARTHNQYYYVNRMQDLIAGRLNEFSQVFHHLSSVFARINGREIASDKEDLTRLFDQIASHICSSCPLYRSCWRRDFYNTYANMFDMLTICELKGAIGKEEMPEALSKKCLKADQIIDTINNIYASYRTGLRWKRRIRDCRELVADQLDGIGHVVSQLASEIDMEVKFKNDLEETVCVELDRKGIRVREVLVLEKPGASIEINITKKPCMGKRECKKKLAPIISSLVGKPMTSLEGDCIQAGRDLCCLRFIEARKFDIATGVARRAKDGNRVSGDSYSFTPIRNGSYLLALSDGMGSGTRANEESSAVISLLESFLEAGFDQLTTIKTINSILMLRSSEEIFATLDLCIVDLVDAGMEFIKIGAVPSFIYRAGSVEIIKKTGLPIGIIEDVDSEQVGCDLMDEDIIILVTDGVLEAFSAHNDPAQALALYISSLRTGNPQFMADSILDKALALSEGRERDDMTVLAGRVWKPLD